MSLPTLPSLAAVEETLSILRGHYRDAVRLNAREEILAELAEEEVTVRLHTDTARFHHGSAHAYARALELLVGEGLDVYEDKRETKWTTREADLAPMRCQGRRYRVFDRDKV